MIDFCFSSKAAREILGISRQLWHAHKKNIAIPRRLVPVLRHGRFKYREFFESRGVCELALHLRNAKAKRFLQEYGYKRLSWNGRIFYGVVETEEEFWQKLRAERLEYFDRIRRTKTQK